MKITCVTKQAVLLAKNYSELISVCGIKATAISVQKRASKRLRDDTTQLQTILL